jgi:hypothetical protein
MGDRTDGSTGKTPGIDHSFKNTIMRSIYYIFTVLLLAASMTACKKNSAGSTTVYMPAGNKSVSATFDLTDTIPYTASLVGADYPTVSTSAAGSITVSFKVNADLVAAFNKENGTNYPILPAANYSFDASGVIAKGGTATAPLNLIIKNGDQLQPFSSYLLPLSIGQVSGGQAAGMQQTTYYIITRSPALQDLPAFDRSAWTIAGFSTQEPAEGNGNGLATTAIDGNLDTYWQTQWAGSEPGPPHYITIDMGAVTTMHGISIVDRSFQGDWATNGHGQPKAMTVALSTDGTNWTDDGSFLVPIVEPQAEIRFFLPVFQAARYFRVTVTSVWATNSTNIAEIYAL